MSSDQPKKPLLHRLVGWPALVIGTAVLSLGAVLQDWVLALLGACVVVFAIAELVATPPGRG